jgi:hypothetical protein
MRDIEPNVQKAKGEAPEVLRKRESRRRKPEYLY